MPQDNGQFPIGVARGKLIGENLWPCLVFFDCSSDGFDHYNPVRLSIPGKRPVSAPAIPIFNSYFFPNFAPLNALKNTSKFRYNGD
jgi:hypothetical protein